LRSEQIYSYSRNSYGDLSKYIPVLGIIEEIGANVTKFKVGDPVLGHKLPFRVR